MFLSSLYFALLAEHKIWQTIETYSPQTFSVTAAVVAPAVVICLTLMNELPVIGYPCLREELWDRHGANIASR